MYFDVCILDLLLFLHLLVFGLSSDIRWQGCEREVAEAAKGDSDKLKSESIMRLSWALVHSRQAEDVQRGIAMLEGKPQKIKCLKTLFSFWFFFMFLNVYRNFIITKIKILKKTNIHYCQITPWRRKAILLK